MDVTSFGIDHDRLLRGIYVSRKDQVGDGVLTTFDVRMKEPNRQMVMDTSVMHTIEHLMAVYFREKSDWKDESIYVGPMGCRTGFYFLTRDAMSGEQAIDLVRECFAFIADFEGKIPGSERKECGNYLEHDLPGAKATAADMCKVLEHWTVPMLQYDYQA